jgi:hypothetical protein
VVAVSPKPFANKRRSVTVILRVPAGRNAYGNAEYTDSEVEVGDCLVAPTSSSETNDNADRTVDSATVYNLSGTWPDNSAGNRVRLDDGSMWEINGTPERWPGAIGGVVVQLQKVRG